MVKSNFTGISIPGQDGKMKCHLFTKCSFMFRNKTQGDILIAIVMAKSLLVAVVAVAVAFTMCAVHVMTGCHNLVATLCISSETIHL